MLPEAISEEITTSEKSRILNLLPYEEREGYYLYDGIWFWLTDESTFIPSELEYKYLIDFPNNLEVDQWTRWLNNNPDLIYYYKGVYQGNEDNFEEFKKIVRDYWNKNKKPLINKFRANN